MKAGRTDLIKMVFLVDRVDSGHAFASCVFAVCMCVGRLSLYVCAAFVGCVVATML